MHYYLLFNVHNALTNFNLNKTWCKKNLLVYLVKKGILNILIFKIQNTFHTNSSNLLTNLLTYHLRLTDLEILITLYLEYHLCTMHIS